MSESVSAARPIIGGLTMHLKTAPGSIAQQCLMVGAPGRARYIAQKYLSEVRQVGGDDNRYYLCYTGWYGDVRISVVTHGIGCPSMAIAFEEILQSTDPRKSLWAIRIGSCSTLKKDVSIGHSAIVSAAIPPGAGIDTTFRSSAAVTRALVEAAKKLGRSYHLGICATTDSFTGGQGRPNARGFLSEADHKAHEERMQGGVAFYDMENAGLLRENIPGQIYAGSVMAIYGNRATDQLVEHAGDEQTIQIGLNAMHTLAMRYNLT